MAENEWSIHSDFFEFGGDSLLAARLTTELRQALAVDVGVHDVFRERTIARLAAHCEQLRSAGIPIAEVEFSRVESERAIPLSFAQEQIWLHQQLAPEAVFYNEPLDLMIPEKLDVAAFEEAFNIFLERHEVLRAQIRIVDGPPMQRFAPHERQRLRLVDLRHLLRNRADADALHRAEEQARRPFDLAQGGLFRAMLVRLAEDTFRLFVVGHHLVFDGVTMVQVFMRELETAYRALVRKDEPRLPPIQTRFRDFASWERSVLPHEREQRWSQQESYWQRKLAEYEPLVLPFDHPRSKAVSFAGAYQCFALSSDLSTKLREFARKHATTLFATLLAAFKTLLFRYSQQSNLTVASVVSNRSLPGLDHVAGDFLNTILLRSEIPRNGTFLETLAIVAKTCVEAIEHSELPFQRVVRHVLAQDDTNRANPLQAVFVLEPPVEHNAAGWTLGQHAVHTRTSKFDLTFELDDRPFGIIARVEYRTDVFEAATINRMIRHFERLLQNIVEAPHTPLTQLAMLDAEDKHLLLTEWQKSGLPRLSNRPLHQLFEAQVDRTPNATAIICDNERLTYRELDIRANQLAQRLLELGAGPAVKIGIWTERSAAHPVILLGILKAGAACVPLDSRDPSEWAAMTFSNAGVLLVVVDNAHASRLSGSNTGIVIVNYEDQAEQTRIAQMSPERVARAVCPDSLAYVLHTSGTTGRPKGVLLEHQHIALRLHFAEEHLSLANGDVQFYFLSLGFDFAVWVWWSTLTSGAAVLLARDDEMGDPHTFTRFCHMHGVTHLGATPAFLEQLVESVAMDTVPLRCCFIGGSRLTGRLVTALRPSGAVIFNVYGPTETSIFATTWTADIDVSIPPIGKPRAGTRVYVLSQEQQLLPIGAIGELYIGGEGVARGYLGQPDLTRERFVPDPFVSADRGGTMYRTGDLVRWLPSGDLEFIGRGDRQEKIRGHRIELGGIEEAIRAVTGIQQVVTIVRQNQHGIRRLVAYLGCGGSEPNISAIKESLRARIPDSMIPAQFITMPALPLVATGKVNVRVLPEALEHADNSRDMRLAPHTDMEHRLHKMVSSVLGIDHFSIQDDFYHIGGDSISSMRIVSLASAENLRITVKDILECRTIEVLAQRIQANTKTTPRANPSSDQSTATIAEELTGSCPLSPIQSWFFEQKFVAPHHFNQAFVFEALRPLEPQRLQAALHALIAHHDTLRLRYEPSGRQHYLRRNDASAYPRLELVEGFGAAEISAHAEQRQKSLDIHHGPVIAATLFSSGTQQKVWLGIHHLLVDGVSWRILMQDLGLAYTQLEQGQPVRLPPSGRSFRHYVHTLEDYANHEAVAQIDHWRAQVAHEQGIDVAPTVGTQVVKRMHLSKDLTTELLQHTGRMYQADINTLLLAALHKTLLAWHHRAFTVWLEGHGREPIHRDMDLSRTMGWFTSLFPVRFPEVIAESPAELIASTNKLLRVIPDKGIGYLALRYLSKSAEIRESLRRSGPVEISFNYLGQFDQLPTQGILKLTHEDAGRCIDEQNQRLSALEVNGLVLDGALRMDWNFVRESNAEADIEAIFTQYQQALTEIIVHARTLASKGGDVEEPNKALEQTLIRFRTSGARPPFFLVHPAGGSASSYRQIADALDPDQPVYGLDAPGSYTGQTISTMASDYLRAVRSVQPTGPYYLGGWSLGGTIVFEMARQLEACGQSVGLVAMLDARPTANVNQRVYLEHMMHDDAALLSLMARHVSVFSGKNSAISYQSLLSLPAADRENWFHEQLLASGLFTKEDAVDRYVTSFVANFRRACALICEHVETPIQAEILLLRANTTSMHYDGFPALEEPLLPGVDDSYGWRSLTRGQVRIRMVPGTHEDLVFAPHAKPLADILGEELRQAMR